MDVYPDTLIEVKAIAYKICASFVEVAVGRCDRDLNIYVSL